jgi:hypothetical protein
MLGIKWESDPWERIQAGDLEGLSIYGRAEKVPLQKRAIGKALTVPYADEVIVDLVYGAQRAAEKAADAMGMDAVAHEHDLDGRTVFMPGPDHETYVETYNDIAEGEGSVEATAKADEDPCWEGYTMVGTDDNGDPRCVPDDEVPDADFSQSLTPAETREGATPKGDSAEQAKQNSMTDDDTDPSVADLQAKVEGLTETVTELKDAVPDDDGAAAKADSMDELVAEFAEEMAEMEGVDMATGDIAQAVDEALKADDGMDDDEDDEDMEDKSLDGLVESIAQKDDVNATPDEIASALGPMVGKEDDEKTEKSANDGGYFEKAASGNGGAAATNDGGSVSGNPLATRADALED